MKLKNLFAAAALAVLLASCSPQKFVSNTYYFDYTPYTSDGFFLTQLESVPFDYQALGSMEVVETSGNDKEFKQVKESKNFDDAIYNINGSSVGGKNWRWADEGSALSSLVKNAKTIGGDGIVALKFNNYIDEKSKAAKVSVSGMVIKRK